MLFTYATLSAAIQNWVEDNSIEMVDGAIPQIIGLAELRILKDLQLSTFDAVVDGVFVANDPMLQKPTDAVQTLSLYLVRNRYQLIANQGETDYDGVGPNGTFFGGAGYAVLDQIILDDGSELVVDAVDGFGAVTWFTINSVGIGAIRPGMLYTANDDNGFTLTPGTANETLVTAGAKRDRLSFRNLSYLLDYQEEMTPAGIPFMYADIDDQSWTIEPRPDFGYTYEAQCIIRPGSLVKYTTIVAQDESSFDGVDPNGSFAGGTGYAGADTITLSDGTVILVDAVGGGVVTEFTVLSASVPASMNGQPTQTLTQVVSSGAGIGFSITLGSANEEVYGATTTWLSEKMPELMFYACQVESERFIKSNLGEAGRIEDWKSAYAESLQASQFEMRTWSRQSYMPLKAGPGAQ